MVTHELRVRYVECDMQGHVFNAHYLTWADMAHTAFWNERVEPYDAFVARGHDLVVAEAHVRFRAPCHYDDVVAIDVEVEACSTSSLTTRLRMRRGDEPVAEVRLRHVCVDARTMTKAPWPDDVRAALEPRAGEGAGAG